MVFMIFALTKTFATFHVSDLMQDSLRWAISAVVILAAGWLAAQIPLRGDGATRMASMLQLAGISVVCALVAWPALFCTHAVTADEGRTILHSLLPGRATKAGPIAGEGQG